jgi:hypothetical protein
MWRDEHDGKLIYRAGMERPRVGQPTLLAHSAAGHSLAVVTLPFLSRLFMAGRRSSFALGPPSSAADLTYSHIGISMRCASSGDDV